MDLVNDSDFDLTDDIVLAAYIAGCACVAYVETYMTKVPMHTNIQTGYEWYGYSCTKRVCLEESVAMTLVVLGHASGNRVVHDRFQHSSETVHRHVATVVTLVATVLAPDIIKPTDRTFRNGCIGAIDGVHVEVVVPVDEQHPYRGKYYLVDSGYPTKQGFLAPYKGERYHIPEFNRGE
ncbi:uncharacterized protein LOC142635220 [Castanea sativa]|uniref:uncharacterized protein LOC142635220 n=1 Tax=Castanea sativa TaxID=21020 RepID=UPI003F654631